MLIKTEWIGRDEWYTSLFSDETLRELQDYKQPFLSLATLLFIDSDNRVTFIASDKWGTFIARLLNHQDRTVRDTAAHILFTHFRNLGRETLLSLLPWLTDQHWLSDEGRGWLIASLGEGQVPECVPWLISILGNEDDGMRTAAAQALKTYHVPQAGSALRKAAQKANQFDKSYFADALISSGGLTDEEMVIAIEVYVRTDRDLDSLDWRIGSRLSDSKQAPIHLVPTLLDRVKELRKNNSDLADKLLIVIQRWPVLEIFENLVERINDGTADELAINQALVYREKLCASVRYDLRAMVNRGGRAAGITAVLLGEQANQIEILKGSDIAAQTALLACARLVRDPLPVEMVGNLYKQRDQTLKLAVDRYLESDDSAAARKLILAHHPGEALILGARGGFDPRREGKLFKWEEKLRQEVLQADGPDEIVAMSTSRNDDWADQVVIRVRGGKAVITKQTEHMREEYRVLSNSEWQELSAVFNETEFDNLPPLLWISLSGGAGKYMFGATTYVSFYTEFVRVNRNGGRRVFSNSISPDRKGKTPHHCLYSFFKSLTKADGFIMR